MPSLPLLRFGPYRLQGASGQLWRHTQIVKLPPKAAASNGQDLRLVRRHPWRNDVVAFFIGSIRHCQRSTAAPTPHPHLAAADSAHGHKCNLHNPLRRIPGATQIAGQARLILGRVKGWESLGVCPAVQAAKGLRSDGLHTG